MGTANSERNGALLEETRRRERRIVELMGSCRDEGRYHNSTPAISSAPISVSGKIRTSKSLILTKLYKLGIPM